MGELRLPSLGAVAARPALGPWSGDRVGDRFTKFCRNFKFHRLSRNFCQYLMPFNVEDLKKIAKNIRQGLDLSQTKVRQFDKNPAELRLRLHLGQGRPRSAAAPADGDIRPRERRHA